MKTTCTNNRAHSTVLRSMIITSTVLLFASSLVPTALKAQQTEKSYDIVVAGAGTGGTAAAIQAARLGSHVALLEESDWIGGQMAAAAVGTMDEAFGPKSAEGSGFYIEYLGRESTAPSGFYGEYLQRITAYYHAHGKTINTCYWNVETHCFDPRIAQLILYQIIDDVNSGKGAAAGGHIDVYLQDRVVRVLSKESTVTGVVTSKQETLHSKVLIDATEYGDVLPLTPARYRSGHVIGEDKANGCIQSITWTAVIKKYPSGVPEQLQMHHPPPGYDKWLAQFRFSMTAAGNPLDRDLPVNFPMYVAYRAVPDLSNPIDYSSVDYQQMTRTSMNWFNDFEVTTAVLDRAKRKQIICEAKLKTLANLYYIQTEMGEKLWSVADDEGYDTAYNRDNSCSEIPTEYKAIENQFPQIPYVRESNRLIGEYTVTGGDIRRESQGAPALTNFRDSIAVGDYADDLHSCTRNDSDFETDLEHITDLPPGFRAGPYQIPLRALIPEKIDGLLAAEKNYSQSRLVSATSRLQPITMLTGQAVGVLAGLAVANHIEPRAISPDQMQIALLRSGNILAREHISDIAPGTKEWQAIQFVLTHEWMSTLGKDGFRSSLILPRGSVATILLHAFLDNRARNPATTNSGDRDAAPLVSKQAYEDVPLYHPLYNAIALLHDAGAAPLCAHSPNDFCPNDSLTVGEFLRSVMILDSRTPGHPPLQKSILREGISASDSEPLSRGDAALILYNIVISRTTGTIGLH